MPSGPIQTWSTWTGTETLGEYTSDSGDGLLRATMLVDNGPKFHLISIRLKDSNNFFTADTFIDIATLSAASGNTSHIAIISTNAFYNCTGIKTISIPDGVTWINESAFQGATGLTSVNIPSTVTYIGFGAFYGCSSLTSITIPASVAAMERYVFAGATSLATVTFTGTPSIQRFESNLFDGCTSLRSIIIPESIVYIGESVFFWPSTGCERCAEPGSVLFEHPASDRERTRRGVYRGAPSQPRATRSPRTRADRRTDRLARRQGARRFRFV